MFDQDSGGLSLSRQAYECLRDQIVTLRRVPGSLLDEAELMKSLGLGRTPIREALQRLAREGLVLIRPRRGIYVANLNLTDLQQIFELRQVLEGYAAALAAERATDADLAALEEALAPLAQNPEQTDTQAYIEIDSAFHRALARSAHNAYLEDNLARMYNLNLRLWYFSLSKIGPIREAIEQHRAVVEAIHCHDGHIAEAAVRKHIRDFQMRVKAII
jgi:DNA-binding GntR family transcriptional regulator